MTVAIGLLGTALNAYGQIQQSNAMAASATANAQAAQQNSQLASQQSNTVEAQKQSELRQIGQKKQAVLAGQRTGMAASGVDVGYGSGLDILKSTAVEAQKDVNATEYNAALKRWGYDVQSASYEQQANQYEQQAGQYKTMGTLGALGTVAGGLYSQFGGGKMPDNTSAATSVYNSSPQADAFGQTYGTVSPKWNSYKSQWLNKGWM